MDSEIYIPIVMFISIAVVAVAFFYFKARHRGDVQVTLRQAIEKGQELSPELIERLSGAVDPAIADLRRAAISLSLGIGIVIFGLALGEEDAMRPLFACAAFPLMLGFAYLLLWWRARET